MLRWSAALARYILAGSIALASCSATIARASGSEAILIERAEEFVRVNGYTEAPPNKDWAVTESSDMFIVDDEVLFRMRHGTLRACAVGLYRGRAGDPFAAIVPFAFAPKSRAAKEDPRRATEVGRAVVLDNAGRPLHMMHYDWPLERIDVRRAGDCVAK